MTIYDMLVKLTGGLVGLTEMLEKVAEDYPDLAPRAQAWLAALDSAASQNNLVRLASLLPKEIADIASGKIDPREHPSDLI